MIMNYLLLALPFVGLFFYLKWVHYGMSGKELEKIIKKEKEEAERRRLEAERAAKMKSALSGETWSDKMPEGLDFLGFYNNIGRDVKEMTQELLMKAGLVQIFANNRMTLGEKIDKSQNLSSDITKQDSKIDNFVLVMNPPINVEKPEKGNSAKAFCENLHQMLYYLSLPNSYLDGFTDIDSANLKNDESKAVSARPYAQKINKMIRRIAWHGDDHWDERYATMQFMSYLKGLPDHDDWPIDPSAPWDDYLLMATTFGGERRLLDTLLRRKPELANTYVGTALSGGNLPEETKKAMLKCLTKMASGALLAYVTLKTFQTVVEVLEEKKAEERRERERERSYSRSSSSSWSSSSGGGSYGGGSSGGGGAGGSW